jgi:ATP-dependent DNA helicase PIF1
MRLDGEDSLFLDEQLAGDLEVTFGPLLGKNHGWAAISTAQNGDRNESATAYDAWLARGDNIAGAVNLEESALFQLEEMVLYFLWGRLSNELTDLAQAQLTQVMGGGYFEEFFLEDVHVSIIVLSKVSSRKLLTTLTLVLGNDWRYPGVSSMTQDQALTILKTGTNVFLTGEPGSGKSHTINQYVAYLREHGIDVAVTASTGIAATHVGGTTIHSWSGIGIRTSLDKGELQKIASRRYVTHHMKRARVLIIDEVSMLTPATLSLVDAVCKTVRQNPQPFGGLQIVFVGDFFQLPPVVRYEPAMNRQASLLEESVARFAYDSPAWLEAGPTVCYLTEQHRQDDDHFLSVLSAIRSDTFDEDHLQHLESRKVAYHAVPAEVPKLFSHNKDVDSINEDRLTKLAGEVYVFPMTCEGPEGLVNSLKQGCLSPEKLALKIGAKVMFTKNNPQEGFFNGTLGTVEGFDKESKRPIILTRNGRHVTVEPMDWLIAEDRDVKARITQLPLRLAWAITVHKSQGMSLDEAVVDLAGVFEYGQGYVALSRVRRLSGLYLLGWNARAFAVHPEVLERDRAFRAASHGADRTYAQMSAANLQEAHDAFIKVSGGGKQEGISVEPKSETSEGSGFEAVRAQYPNAYRPWSEDQDKQLRSAFAQGMPTVDLVAMFGRQHGGIISRLKKLGLVKD